MLSRIKTLYNSGENDGDVCITSADGFQISSHSYVVRYASETIKYKIDFENKSIIELNYDKKIIDIILNFSYSEDIHNIELDADEILSLFSLIHFLKMDNFIMELTNYYSRNFYKTLNLNNWLHVLCSIYNIDKYSDLFEPLIEYIKNSVMINNNALQTIIIESIDNEIKSFLLKICFTKINELNDNLNEIINDKDTLMKQHMNNVIISDSFEDDNESLNELEIKMKKVISKPKIIKKLTK
jgi:hypothetical protein